MALSTGDLIAVVDSLPSDGHRTRTLLVLRANADGSHDVVDLGWSGLGGGGLVLRLAPATLHPATGRTGVATVQCVLASEAKLSSLPVHDYGQRKLEFKSGIHAENARPTAISLLERITGRAFGPEQPTPEADLISLNTVCQWKKGDRLVWMEARGGGVGSADRFFYACVDPLAVLAIFYSEEGGLRESGFTIVSETDDLAGPFEWISGEFRKTPLVRR
ncbi:MAG TPA: hypothetical protein VMV18_13675 [bacterium]|nr:hypothetical protein [bacterium]